MVAAKGDKVEMERHGVWWPMRVVGWRGERLRLRSDAYGKKEGDRVKKPSQLRPAWEWRSAGGGDPGQFVFTLGGGAEQTVEARRLEVGGTARLVGQRKGSGLEKRMVELREEQVDGRWRLRDCRTRYEWNVSASQLQPVAAAPPPAAERTANLVAKEQACSWLQATATEARAIAQALKEHAGALSRALQPRKAVKLEVVTWREARRNYESVGELRAALQVMDKGKTGQSHAVEQLLHLNDCLLEPWLHVTSMFFEGEIVDEMNLGVVSPLPKNEKDFRPVTLLEPLHKCCMATVASKLLRSMHEFGILDLAQYGFVVDGSCQEPLKVMAHIFERGRAKGGNEEMHVAFLDATAAFDSVPHPALDAALRRLGAPPDFVTWLRVVLTGHRRKAANAYGVQTDDEAVTLEGGTPQGSPASPLIWVIVIDYALSVVRDNADAADGVNIGGEMLWVIGFADDLACASRTREGLQRTVQTLVAAMGAIGVRFNAKKSFYTWSSAAAAKAQLDAMEVPKQPLTVDVLDAEGRWRSAPLTSVPPEGDPDGDTLAERGVARYLGVYYSFEGCGGEPWAEQDQAIERVVGAFFAALASVEPTPRQYRTLVRSLLHSKAMYGGRVRLPSSKTLDGIRRKVAQGMARLLKLGSLGGGGATFILNQKYRLLKLVSG